MARIRQFKPEFFSDAKMARASRDARLLFFGLLSEADDEGRLVDSPKRLAGCVFPFDEDVTPKRMAQWLDELLSLQVVLRYSVNGEGFLLVRRFKTHQKIARPRRSSLPAPPDDIHSARELHADDVQDALPMQEECIADLGNKGTRGQGVEGTRDKRAAKATGLPPDFMVDDDLRAWASQRVPGLDLTAETERFKDHHQAKGSTFKDWRAAWRTWMSRSEDFKPSTSTNGKGRTPIVQRSWEAIERGLAYSEGGNRDDVDTSADAQLLAGTQRQLATGTDPA